MGFLGGLLLKIPYVKQIGIGILICLMVYMWYLMNANDTLRSKNGQLQMAVDGWETSYNSLIKEMERGEALLDRRRAFITTLEEQQNELKDIVQKYRENNQPLKDWFDTKHPNSVFDLRKQLRDRRDKTTTDN